MLKGENIIDCVEQLMLTDEVDIVEQSALVREYYEESTKEEQHRINLIFIALCGYSLETIIKDLE